MYSQVYPNRKEISRAFGDWLNRYKWDWWATFTFRRDIGPAGAKKSLTRFLSQQKRGATWFQALEWHRYRDSVHIHSLVGNVSDLRRLSVMDEWFKKYGIARIWPYQEEKGARYYLSKYIIKELADWDFKIDNQNKFDFGELKNCSPQTLTNPNKLTKLTISKFN